MKTGISRGALAAIIIVTVVAALASSAGMLYLMSSLSVRRTVSPSADYVLPTASPTEPLRTADPDADSVTVTTELARAVQSVYEKCSPSVVGIRTTVRGRNIFGQSVTSSGEGSGVIYTTDGYIITNYHVVSDALTYTDASVQVFLPSAPTEGIDAGIVGYNISGDLAVLHIDRDGLPALAFADSDTIRTGDFAVAIGNPGGLEFMGSASFGIISGLNRKLTGDGMASLPLIQTDAAINPGNSGGALLDLSGRLIGINSSKIVDSRFDNMGFAIPSNSVRTICENIITHAGDPAAYLGITVSTRYSATQLQYMGYPSGAVVENVAENSPAAAAGLTVNDIIVSMQGTTVSDYNDYAAVVGSITAGQTVELTYYRYTTRQYTTVTFTASSNG